MLELTGGLGAEKVVDLGGAGTLPHSYQAVGPGGEVLVIGVMTRPEGDLSPYPLMPKAATLRGIFVGGREHFESAQEGRRGQRAAARSSTRYSISSPPADAYEHMKAAKHFGKIVITI